MNTDKYISFTFHYASTLSIHARKPHRVDCIYIPLCFYFIGFAENITNSVQIDLHSIMLLLYLFRNLEFLVDVPDLHSIMLLLYLDQRRHSHVKRYDLHSIMLLLYQMITVKR